MNKFLLSFLILITYESTAQLATDSIRNKNNYIINTTAYKAGIYKTFDEFKYNNPSIVNNYTFDQKRLWLTDSKTGKKVKIKKEKSGASLMGREYL